MRLNGRLWVGPRWRRCAQPRIIRYRDLEHARPFPRWRAAVHSSLRGAAVRQRVCRSSLGGATLHRTLAWNDAVRSCRDLPVSRDGSTVSEAAWALHHECKYDLIATLPRSGGHITAETIRTWITTHPVFPADPLLRPLEHLDGGQHLALGQ